MQMYLIIFLLFDMVLIKIINLIYLLFIISLSYPIYYKSLKISILTIEKYLPTYNKSKLLKLSKNY